MSSLNPRTRSIVGSGLLKESPSAIELSGLVTTSSQNADHAYELPATLAEGVVKNSSGTLSFSDQLTTNQQSITDIISRINALQTRYNNLPGITPQLSNVKNVTATVNGPVSTDSSGYLSWSTTDDTSVYTTGLPELQFTSDMNSFTPTQDALMIIWAQSNTAVKNTASFLHINQGGLRVASAGYNASYWTFVNMSLPIFKDLVYTFTYSNIGGGSQQHFWNIFSISIILIQ